MEHRVHPAHIGIAEAGVLVLLLLAYPAVFLRVVVELLDVPPGELFQRDVAQRRDDAVDVPLIEAAGAVPDVWAGIDLVPGLYPALDRVRIRLGDVDHLRLRQGGFQFFLDLRLGLAEDVLADGLAALVVAGDVAALPAPVGAFADAALAHRSACFHSVASSLIRASSPSMREKRGRASSSLRMPSAVRQPDRKPLRAASCR